MNCGPLPQKGNTGKKATQEETKRGQHEKQEQEKRADNFIVCAVEEDHVGDKESEIAQDKEFVDSFLETINVGAKPKQDRLRACHAALQMELPARLQTLIAREGGRIGK